MEIKIYECKLCREKGARHSVRKHIRENHFWKGKKLSDKITTKKNGKR